MTKKTGIVIAIAFIIATADYLWRTHLNLLLAVLSLSLLSGGIALYNSARRQSGKENLQQTDPPLSPPRKINRHMPISCRAFNGAPRPFR
jgi:hypothetical protein